MSGGTRTGKSLLCDPGPFGVFFDLTLAPHGLGSPLVSITLPETCGVTADLDHDLPTRVEPGDMETFAFSCRATGRPAIWDYHDDGRVNAQERR